MKGKDTANACSIYESAVGFGAVLANDEGVVAHHLPYGVTSAAEARLLVAETHPLALAESPLTIRAAEILVRYFAGEKVRFDLPMALNNCTAFQREVYRVVAGIPYGTALSYAEVAAACGSPKGARAIGGAMAKNNLPIIIPCHRVVGTSGVLTGFTAPGGLASKRDLLLMEGAIFDAKGGLLEAGSFRVMNRISTARQIH
jgi:methylated-DNA-[protein]-cysteine S-methyltransferase